MPFPSLYHCTILTTNNLKTASCGILDRGKEDLNTLSYNGHMLLLSYSVLDMLWTALGTYDIDSWLHAVKHLPHVEFSVCKKTCCTWFCSLPLSFSELLVQCHVCQPKSTEIFQKSRKPGNAVVWLLVSASRKFTNSGECCRFASSAVLFIQYSGL